MTPPLDEWAPDDQHLSVAEDSFGDLDGPLAAELAGATRGIRPTTFWSTGAFNASACAGRRV